MKSRYSIRKPMTGRVIVSCGGRVWEGRVVNLTVPGCRVETAYPLAQGQSVQLLMHVEHQPSLHIELGMVRWTTPGEAGIEFIRMTKENQLRLRAYISSVVPRAQLKTQSVEISLCEGVADVEAQAAFRDRPSV